MIVFYRNYRRSDRTYLSIQSAKHFFPNLDYRCLMVYDETPEEYHQDVSKFENIGVKIYYHKKIHKYDRLGNGTPELADWKKQSILKFVEEQSPYNGHILHGAMYTYFTIEYLNVIYEIVKDIDGKVLIADEDQCFTTGETLKFLLENDFDLAYGKEYDDKIFHQVNGDIQAINPKTVGFCFPLNSDDAGGFSGISATLGIVLWLKLKQKNLKLLEIPTREGYTNSGYLRDGIHAQNVNEIIQELDKYKIPYKLLNES